MYEDIKNDILGKKYSLSIAFVSASKSQEINKKYRHKDKPTNVLSFAYSKNEGELVLCRPVIRKELKKFDRNYRELEGFLVIHGMLHLKGMSHSSRMERAEELYCAKYNEKYFYRNRRGVHHDQNSGGRISKRRKRA
jgi:rRNA maturation RNase YbeY